MPKARETLVSTDTTPYYHVVSRCVRRAFLCGSDLVSGKSYEHRRQWVEDRILTLADVFCINICAYAVMSNHYHLTVHIDVPAAHQLSDHEVCERWHRLCAGTLLTQRFLRGESLSQVEREAVKQKLGLWRLRLCNLSWFMKLLNEPIAREANREDGCTGRFWEGRFKSQALLDEKALAACLAYVDLNPVRATLADTPEASGHTSVKRRIHTLRHNPGEQPLNLMPFVGNPREPMPKGLPFRLEDYLALVDWTGRAIRDDKRGAIPQHLPPILDRLDIDPQNWLYLTTRFESKFKGMVGHWYKLKQACHQLGYQRTPGLRPCRQLL